jgi:hypothetical protein
LANLVLCQLLKRYAKSKKSSSPTIWHNFTKACLLRCKMTHTHRLQSSLIHQNKVTMRPYLHEEKCKITHTHPSCSQVVDLAVRGHRTSSTSAEGLETWFLAWLIKENFCLVSLILVYKTKAILNYTHLTRKNNEICSI